MLLIKVDAVPLAKYSPRKMEMGMEKTTEMMRARKEVTIVPTRKGNAPNSLLTGSHVVLKRNPIPKVRIEGSETMRREKKIARRRSKIKAPAAESIFRKADSESMDLCFMTCTYTKNEYRLTLERTLKS
jgi:hypothetical protein